MSFCTKCGAPRSSGGGFCTKCGAPQPATAAAPTPPQSAMQPNAAAPYSGLPVPQKQGHGLRNFLIVAFVLLLVVVGVGVAGAIYAARVAKEKATTLINQVAPGTIATESTPKAGAPSVLNQPGAPGSPDASDVPVPPSFPAMQPTASAPGTPGPAPLKPGMLVVTALADESGDYESMKSVTKVDDTGVTLAYKSAHPKQDTGSQNENAQSHEVSIERKVLTADLNNAHEYAEVFGSNDPESYPGTTAISASREVLAELHQKGATSFSFRPDGLKGAIGSLVSMFGGLGGNTKDGDGAALDKLQKEQCDLKREGTGLYAFPVLLNDQPTTLPALHASCSTDDGPADFYILDQADYPLMLSWKLGSGSSLQVIKITYPPPPKTGQPEPTAMEQQLKEKKKVEIYGIYFDFASDRLKPESTPVLQEIASVMKDNPDWKLTVSGHTDSIGGDAANLDLSKRRAAAVKQALVTQYKISPDRLTTDGFGASRPVDTNDTLAGRARNRRVELTRE